MAGVHAALLAWAVALSLACMFATTDAQVPVVLARCGPVQWTQGLEAALAADGNVQLVVVDGEDEQRFADAVAPIVTTPGAAVLDACGALQVEAHSAALGTDPQAALAVVLASTPLLSTGLGDTHLSLAPTAAQTAQALVAFISAVGWKAAAILTSSTRHALQIVADFRDAAVGANLEPVPVYAYHQNKFEQTFSVEAQRLASDGHRLVVFVPGDNCNQQHQQAADTLAQLGLDDKSFVWLLSDAFCLDTAAADFDQSWNGFGALMVSPGSVNVQQDWRAALVEDVTQVVRLVASVGGANFRNAAQQVAFEGASGQFQLSPEFERSQPLFAVSNLQRTLRVASVQNGQVSFLNSAGSVISRPTDLGLGYAIPKDSAFSIVNVAFAVLRSGSQIGRISQERETAFRAAVEFFNRRNNASVTLEPFVFDAGQGCETTAQRIVSYPLPIHAVIGPGSSSCAIAMSPILTAAGMPHIGFSETSPRLSDKSLYPLFFRIPPSDLFQSNGLASIAERFDWRRVGTIATTDAYGKDLAERFEKAIVNISFEVSARGRFDVGAPDSVIATEMTKLEEGGSAVHLISCASRDALEVMDQAIVAGLAGPGYSWIGTDGSAGLSLEEPVARAFRGMLGLQPRAGAGPMWAEFISEEPNVAVLAATSVLRYVPHIVDAVHAVVQASAIATNTNITSTLQAPELRSRIVSALRTFNSSANGFRAATGQSMWFDSTQDGPPQYNIVNLQENNQWTQVGEFTPEAGLVFTKDPVFSTGGTEPPSFVPPPRPEPESSDSDSTAIIASALVATLFVLGLLIVYICHLKRRMKRAQQAYSFDKEMAAVKSLVQFKTTDLSTPKELSREGLRRLQELGSGFYGQVHKGFYSDVSGASAVEVLVAIKTLKGNAPQSQKQLLLQEAALVAQFTHPNIVKLIGVVTVDQPFCMVLEYCEHGAMSSYLRAFHGAHDLSTRAKLDMAAGAAAGLAFVHKCGCIHRDVASRNYLISSDFSVKLSDFGRAVNIDNLGQEEDDAIPLRWSAPEVLTRGSYSLASDVWAYGVVIWEIWSNAALPYGKLANEAILQTLQLGERLSHPARCPKEIYSLAMLCWEEDPKKRITLEKVELRLKALMAVMDQAEPGWSRGTGRSTPTHGTMFRGSADLLKLPGSHRGSRESLLDPTVSPRAPRASTLRHEQHANTDDDQVAVQLYEYDTHPAATLRRFGTKPAPASVIGPPDSDYIPKGNGSAGQSQLYEPPSPRSDFLYAVPEDGEEMGAGDQTQDLSDIRRSSADVVDGIEYVLPTSPAEAESNLCYRPVRRSSVSTKTITSLAELETPTTMTPTMGGALPLSRHGSVDNIELQPVNRPPKNGRVLRLDHPPELFEVTI